MTMPIADLKPGTPVYYSPMSEGAKKLAGMASGVNGVALPADIQAALAEGRSFRRRGAVDRIIDEETVRLVLCDTYENVWAHPNELEPLDMVTIIADMENSKTIEQQMKEIDDAEAAAGR